MLYVNPWSRTISIKDEDNQDSPELNYHETYRFWMKYFAPYIKTVNIKPDEEVNKYAKIYLPDGATFQAWNGGCLDMYLDVNGAQKPNEGGKDVFLFVFCEKPEIQALVLRPGLYFGPLGMKAATESREKALTMCR